MSLPRNDPKAVFTWFERMLDAGTFDEGFLEVGTMLQDDPREGYDAAYSKWSKARRAAGKPMP